MSIQAYPLCWPDGWKRTSSAYRIRGKFGKREAARDGSTWRRFMDATVTDGTTRILEELNRFGVERQDIVISTNVKVRLDGLPRSGERGPDDPGAAVYWSDRSAKHQTRCMAIDRYDRVADNLAAIAATLDAMRAIERHGGAAILDRAFTGFTALPGPDTARAWRETFGDDITSREQLDARYKALRSQHHPDRGGTAQMFDRVQKAYEQAQQEIRA